MPVKGQRYNFTPFSLASEEEVAQAIVMAKNTAIEALLCLIMGDPNPQAEGWGAKRSAFRWSELFPAATSPASMEVALTEGTAVMNDGEGHQGDWHLLFAAGGEKKVTLSPAHATLDRYDIIYAVPSKVPTGSVTREVVDGQGNVSTVTDHLFRRDEFTLGVVEGTPGGAFPTVGGNPATRQTAWQLLPVGQIPVAIVKVGAAVVEVVQGDITDVRELFDLRTYPIGEQFLASGVRDALGATRPNHLGGIAQVYTEQGEVDVPQLNLFVDMREDPPVLKFKFANDNIQEVAFVEEET